MSGAGVAEPLQYRNKEHKRLNICMVCKTNKNYSIFEVCRKCDSYLYKRSLASGDEVSDYQSTL